MHTYHAIDLDQAIDSLSARINQALSSRDSRAAADCCAVARFLATQVGTVPIRSLAARASAACRFLSGERRHG